MTRSDFYFVVVVNILLIVPMFLFFESDVSTLPSLQTLKAIYEPLWAIALWLTVVVMAVTFFVKKDDELTLKLGLPAMVFLIGADIIVNQMPI